jgi:hypothetical protein
MSFKCKSSNYGTIMYRLIIKLEGIMRQHTLLSLSLISNKTINTSIKEILNIKSKF